MTIKDPLFFSLYVHHHHFLQKPKTIFKAYLVVEDPTDMRLLNKTLNAPVQCLPVHIGCLLMYTSINL